MLTSPRSSRLLGLLAFFVLVTTPALGERAATQRSAGQRDAGQRGFPTVAALGGEAFTATTSIQLPDECCPCAECPPCELAQLLVPFTPGDGQLPSTHPCFDEPQPVPPTEACCDQLDALLRIVAPTQQLPSTHPCIVLESTPAPSNPPEGHGGPRVRLRLEGR